jgi:hypothetical protein
MPAHAWLALAQSLRQLTDREFSLSEQRQNPQPRLLSRRPQRRNDPIRVTQLRNRLSWRYKHIFMWHGGIGFA